MKRNLLLLLLVFVFAKLSGQDYHVINFAGINVAPETIIIKNLTQDNDLTIQGGDVLHLIIKGVSVEEPLEALANQLFIYPNPSEHFSNIQFNNSQHGRVSINLYDITGKLIHDFSGELSVGQHTFQLTGIPAGSYLVKVQTSTSLLSGKFFAAGQSKSALSLQHTNQVPLKLSLDGDSGHNPYPDSFTRSGRSVVEMNFWPGDEMLFVGLASGFDNSGIYDNPTGDETYTFEFTNWYPDGYQHCFVLPTAVVEVTNPSTGKIWMDRNLGASQVATSSTDDSAYGDLYQWGRFADGHQCRNSPTTSTLSNSDQPGHGSFITIDNGPLDWRSPQNTNLWQGVNSVNNPCPSSYRLPTETELNAERLSWSSNNAAGAFASSLKLPMAGNRRRSNGSLNHVGTYGFYWSSTVSSSNSYGLIFLSSNANNDADSRAFGLSVRCLKDESEAPTVTTSVISEITSSSATSGGEVTNDGGAPVTARGVVWSQTESPTIDDNEGITTDGEGFGSFTSQLTGLDPETSYFVRAYAINSAGTAYGNDESFVTEDAGTVWPAGYVHCEGIETVVVEILNPGTGKIWMDRNLGASQVATSSTDDSAYGDLYQWGRFADGHQCRTSTNTSTLATSDIPGHGNFITTSNSPLDWRNPQNDILWQGMSGINNPCPIGFRLPTVVEFDEELLSWSSENASGAFASPLKLPLAGRRYFNGLLEMVGSVGFIYSSTVSGIYSSNIAFDLSAAAMSNPPRVFGFSVRCIKD